MLAFRRRLSRIARRRRGVGRLTRVRHRPFDDPLQILARVDLLLQLLMEFSLLLKTRRESLAEVYRPSGVPARVVDFYSLLHIVEENFGGAELQCTIE